MVVMRLIFQEKKAPMAQSVQNRPGSDGAWLYVKTQKSL